MIVFLLLVIIAILLFGSSVVTGAIGAALGGIVGILALFFGASWLSGLLGISMADMLMYACLALLPLIILHGLVSKGSPAPPPAVKKPAVTPPPVSFRASAPLSRDEKRARRRKARGL